MTEQQIIRDSEFIQLPLRSLPFTHAAGISKNTNFIKTSGTLNSITKPPSVQECTRIKIFETFADVDNIVEYQTTMGHSSPAAYTDVISRYKWLRLGTRRQQRSVLSLPTIDYECPRMIPNWHINEAWLLEGCKPHHGWSLCFSAYCDALTSPQVSRHQTFHFMWSLNDNRAGLVHAGTATCYGLGGPGFELRWGWDFPHLSIPVLGPTQPPVQGLFPGSKVAEAWRWPPIPSSAEIEEVVDRRISLTPLCLHCLLKCSS